MRTIVHKTFEERVSYPVWAWNASGRRERSRERIRAAAEAFINEIGVDHIVSIDEHAPLMGPFSVVVWWQREFAEAGDLVIRASEESRDA